MGILKNPLPLMAAGLLIALSFSGCEQPAGPKLGDIADQVEGAPSAPGRPELLADDHTIVAVWETVLIADSYSVYYSTGTHAKSALKWHGEIELGAGTAAAAITGLDNGVTYYVWVSASNQTGESPKSPYASAAPEAGAGGGSRIFFDYGRMIPNYDSDQAGRFYTVPSGKSLVMSPVLWNIPEGATFAWEVSGGSHSSTGANQRYFTFRPSASGDYTVSVTVNETYTASALVTCTSGYVPRPATGGSQAKAGTVFGFMPGPGQFVDHPENMRGIPGRHTGLAQGAVFNANATAESVKQAVQQVVDAAGSEYIASLGTFGGYLITGFDHSVARRADGVAEISIQGNAFGSWEEPGVVWVSRDDNRDGVPNDTWYEIKGSAYGNGQTRQQYAVTYYLPVNAVKGFGIAKTSLGVIGNAPRNFPLMYNLQYYTLTGTLLGGGDYDGYVDCVGTGRFKISDAVQLDGSSANLDYIDFVKVQNASGGQSGNMGDISCETGVAFDLSIPNPSLRIRGALVTEGQYAGRYSFHFRNGGCGYDMFVAVDGQTYHRLPYLPPLEEWTHYAETEYIYFDYYGGNVLHYNSTPGIITFGAR
jgi:hypothetical protein